MREQIPSRNHSYFVLLLYATIGEKSTLNDKKGAKFMITIHISAYIDGSWVEQPNFTRPLSGSNKLDETLDSAVTNFTLQEQANQLPPFTEIKIVGGDGENEETRYFVVASPDGKKPRMV